MFIYSHSAMHYGWGCTQSGLLGDLSSMLLKCGLLPSSSHELIMGSCTKGVGDFQKLPGGLGDVWRDFV